MFNFSELKTKVAILAQRSDDSDYVAKIGVWLNMSHKFLTEVYDYWIDLQETYPFATVDGTEDYPLPNNFDKPFRLFDLTNKKTIPPETQEVYVEENLSAVADATEGKPTKYRIYGTTGLMVPIATTGDTVKVKSSSLSDTGGIIVRIRGYIDSALLIEDFENITILSATPTTFVAGTKTFYKITHVSKSANTVGFVTIANSSDETLETLSPIDRVARHKVLKLGKIPDDAYTMRLLYKKTIPELVNDYDYPFTECDRYLLMDAWGWSLKQDKDDNRANQAWEKAGEALKALLANQNSQLGPAYQNKIVSTWLQAHRNRR